MTRHTLRNVADGVHVLDAPQRFYGLEVGARMTVLELDRGLLVHSPVAVDPATITPLGTPRWVLAPNLFHHLHIGPWVDAGLEAWAPAGLADKRPDVHFHGVIDRDDRPFGNDVQLLPLTCFPTTNEVAVLHRPSRTLIVSDLVFHFPASAPLLTRFAMRCLGGYPGCRTTLLERFGLRRAAARHELRTLLAWDFDRLIMAHGDIIETQAKARLLDAFHWLDVAPSGRLHS